MRTPRTQIITVLVAFAVASVGCTGQPTAEDPPVPEVLDEAVLVLDTDCANVGTVSWEEEEWRIMDTAPGQWWHNDPITGKIIIEPSGYEGTFKGNDGLEVPVVGRLEALNVEVVREGSCTLFD